MQNMVRNMISFFENMNNPVWIMDKNSERIFFNLSFKSCFNIDSTWTMHKTIEYMKSKEEYDFLLKEIFSLNRFKNNTFTYEDKVYKCSVSPFCENNESWSICNILDVSDIVDSNEKLMLRTVIDNIPSLIFYKDKDLKYVGINKACQDFYKEKGITEIIGKNDLELPLERSFIEICNEHDKLALASKEPLYIEEKVVMPDTSQYRIFQTIKTPVVNNKNKVVGLVGVVRDMTEYKLEEERLTYLSYTDSLTGLYNRVYFYKKVEELVLEEQFPIGIIFGDINGLKMVNDTLGHHAGDQFIITMADCLRECCREKGISVRWSGDEFSVILPKSSTEECREFMDSINKVCSSKVYDKFQLVISLGYSLLDKGGNVDNVLIEAEDKVYKQKILSSKSIRISTLHNLRDSLKAKNVETEEHTERVARYCEEVGRIMELDDETLEKLVMVGQLHDIGKIGIPEHILLKPGKLTESEFEVMKTHSEKGYRLALLLPELSHISRCILTHHERWDGAGYPLGLKGEEIPLISRIVGVVDSYDAMVSERVYVYSKAKSQKEAIEELKICAGKQFDPRVVEIFCNIIQKIPN